MLTAPTTEETCSICLEPLDPHATGNASQATLPCGHAFHCACILKVARSDTHCHGMCPLCRATPDGHTEPADEEPLEDETLLSSRAAAYLAGLPSSAWTSAFRVPADYETDDALLGRAMNLTSAGESSDAPAADTSARRRIVTSGGSAGAFVVPPRAAPPPRSRATALSSSSVSSRAASAAAVRQMTCHMSRRPLPR